MNGDRIGDANQHFLSQTEDVKKKKKTIFTQNDSEMSMAMKT